MVFGSFGSKESLIQQARNDRNQSFRPFFKVQGSLIQQTFYGLIQQTIQMLKISLQNRQILTNDRESKSYSNLKHSFTCYSDHSTDGPILQAI